MMTESQWKSVFDSFFIKSTKTSSADVGRHAARKFGKFVAEPSCACGDNSLLRAIKFWKVEYDVDLDANSLEFLGCASAGIGTAMAFWRPVCVTRPRKQCAIQTLNKCCSCGHEMSKIYALTEDTCGGAEKRSAFGHFIDMTAQTELDELSTADIQFLDIEKEFDKMWTESCLVYNKQKRWTDQLIRRFKQNEIGMKM